MEEKLKVLANLMATEPQSPYLKDLAKEIKDSCSTVAEELQIEDFVAKGIAKLTTDVEELHSEALKLQLGEVSDMVNLSYIAKTYFKKSRAWLSQRINGNTVNGKTCKFTDEELATLNNALHDMSIRIGGLTLNY